MTMLARGSADLRGNVAFVIPAHHLVSDHQSITQLRQQTLESALLVACTGASGIDVSSSSCGALVVISVAVAAGGFYRNERFLWQQQQQQNEKQQN